MFSGLDFAGAGVKVWICKSCVELEIPSLVGLAQSESFNIQSKKISCCTRLEQEEAASLWNLFKT